MRPILLVLLGCAASCSNHTERSGPQSDTTAYATNVAYSRGEYLYYYSTITGKHGTLSHCSDPSFSPDGAKLAYTAAYYERDPQHPGLSNRRVDVLDVQTGHINTIHYNSSQYCCPDWSHDGKHIAFRAVGDGGWRMVLVDANLTSYRELTPGSGIDYSGGSWTPDNPAILTYNFDTVFVIDTSNVVQQTHSIKEVTNNARKSSAMQFTLTPDSRSLLFIAENVHASLCNNKNPYQDGLPEALFAYDLHKKSLRQITPDSLYCNDYQVAGDIIYFTAAKKCDPFERSIYTIDRSGRNVKEFIKDAHDITVSR